MLSVPVRMLLPLRMLVSGAGPAGRGVHLGVVAHEPAEVMVVICVVNGPAKTGRRVHA